MMNPNQKHILFNLQWTEVLAKWSPDMDWVKLLKSMSHYFSDLMLLDFIIYCEADIFL